MGWLGNHIRIAANKVSNPSNPTKLSGRTVLIIEAPNKKASRYSHTEIPYIMGHCEIGTCDTTRCPATTGRWIRRFLLLRHEFRGTFLPSGAQRGSFGQSNITSGSALPRSIRRRGVCDKSSKRRSRSHFKKGSARCDR